MIALDKLFDLAGGRCTYCNCETYVACRQKRSAVLLRFQLVEGSSGVKKALRYRRATREHLVRIADGGRDAAENLSLSCAFCNAFRGTAPPTEHRAAMQRLAAAGLHPNHPQRSDLSKTGLRRARLAVCRLGQASAAQSALPDLPPPALPAREPTGASSASSRPEVLT